MRLMLLWLMLLLLLLVLLHMMLHHCGHRWQPHIFQRGAAAALHQARRRLAAAHGNYIKVFDCVNKIKCEKRRENVGKERRTKTNDKRGRKSRGKQKQSIFMCYSIGEYSYSFSVFIFKLSSFFVANFNCKRVCVCVYLCVCARGITGSYNLCWFGGRHSPFSSGAFLYFSSRLTAIDSRRTRAAGYSLSTSHMSFLLSTKRSL